MANENIIDEKIKEIKQEADNAEVSSKASVKDGTYYAPNKTSFISISSNSCSVYMVSDGTYTDICGFSSSSATGIAGNIIAITLDAGNWYYYVNGSVTKPAANESWPISGSYNALKGTITINSVTYTK